MIATFAHILLSCLDQRTAPEASERALYQSLLAIERPYFEDLQRCRNLSDEALAGDCAMSIAARGSPEPGAWCTEVPLGIWRDECWFKAAETAGEHGNVEQALQACSQSGAFEPHCQYHLWQHEIVVVTKPYNLDQLAAAVAEGRRLNAKWKPLVGEDFVDGALMMVAPGEGFDETFWMRFFLTMFERQEPVDVRYCNAIEVDIQGGCVGAAIFSVRQRLDRMIQHEAHPTCGEKPPADPEAASVHWRERKLRFVADRRVSDAIAGYCMALDGNRPPEGHGPPQHGGHDRTPEGGQDRDERGPPTDGRGQPAEGRGHPAEGGPPNERQRPADGRRGPPGAVTPGR